MTLPRPVRCSRPARQIEHADGTLIALALCHEEAGRLASAWTEFTDVIAEAHRAGRTDWEALAREHVASLEPRLSRLTIVVPDQAAGMTVKRDSAQAVAATWGVAIPVDPGPHVIVVEAPGKRSWSTSVTIGSQADSQTVTVPALQGRRRGKPGPSRRDSGDRSGC